MSENGAERSAGKILLADDDEALIQTLVWILKEEGHEVVVVTDASELIMRLEIERPDALLLEVLMSGSQGLEILKQVKADEKWRDLPILVISSLPADEATVKMLRLGASDFIAKPLRVRELMARVEARLTHSREIHRAREESRSNAEMVDILHEITDSLKADEIYHILTRRVAKALQLSKCSMVAAQPGAEIGTVVAAAENPMLRNLEIPLAKYPELQRALETRKPVLVPDIHSDGMFSETKKNWDHDGVQVFTRSAIVLPFVLRGELVGAFFLRTTENDAPLTESDMAFAEAVISAAVNAIERAHELEAAESDRERFQFLASTDPLTGCVNRRAMLERLEGEMERARRYSHDLTVLMIDLDWFKKINDTRGHMIGDAVLKQLGEILRAEARSVDVVARYGGEEFTLVLPDTDVEGGLVFAERLREKAGEFNYVADADSLYVTVSIGVATYSSQDQDMTAVQIIDKADEALYRAKRAGRNRVHQ